MTARILTIASWLAWMIGSSVCQLAYAEEEEAQPLATKAWSLSQAREYITENHILQVDLSDVPNNHQSLVNWLKNHDSHASITPTVSSSSASLGLLRIYGNDGSTLVFPLIGGPAWSAGIVSAITLKDEHALLNESRVVGVRLDSGELIDQVVTPGLFKAGSVENTLLGNLATMRVTGFVAEKTVRSARYRLLSQQPRNVDSLDTDANKGKGVKILDLRYCAGGDVYEATDFAGLWINERVHWVSVQRQGMPTVPLNTGGRGLLAPTLTAVLVSRYTASACEQLVRGLKTYADVLVLGEQTSGKCTVQTSTPLIGGYWLKITTGMWLGPNDEVCDKSGVMPDKVFTGNLHNDDDVGFWLSSVLQEPVTD